MRYLKTLIVVALCVCCFGSELLSQPPRVRESVQEKCFIFGRRPDNTAAFANALAQISNAQIRINDTIEILIGEIRAERNKGPDINPVLLSTIDKLSARIDALNDARGKVTISPELAAILQSISDNQAVIITAIRDLDAKPAPKPEVDIDNKLSTQRILDKLSAMEKSNEDLKRELRAQSNKLAGLQAKVAEVALIAKEPRNPLTAKEPEKPLNAKEPEVPLGAREPKNPLGAKEMPEAPLKANGFLEYESDPLVFPNTRRGYRTKVFRKVELWKPSSRESRSNLKR